MANRITTCEDLSAIPRDLQAYFGDSRLWLSTPPPRPNEPFGTIIKYAIWPARQEDKAVLRSRYLHAVAADYARLVYESFLKRRKRSPKNVEGSTPFNPYAQDQEELDAHNSEDFAVRYAPVSMARAAAHVFQYPDELLTEDPERVAKVINATMGCRLSTVRGVFRSALPLNPQQFPLHFVPTNPGGVGCVDWAISRLPVVDECLAAREFARIFGLTTAKSFDAISRALGLSFYWLGKISVTLADLARPKKQSDISQAIARHRPVTVSKRHALVYVALAGGLKVLSTWPPVPRETRSARNRDAIADSELMVSNVLANGTYYTLETPRSFAHRWFWISRSQQGQPS